MDNLPNLTPSTASSNISQRSSIKNDTNGLVSSNYPNNSRISTASSNNGGVSSSTSTIENMNHPTTSSNTNIYYWGNTNIKKVKEIPIQPTVNRLLNELTPITTNPDIILSMFKGINTSSLYRT